MSLIHYTRWRADDDGNLTADLLNSPITVGVDPHRHVVQLDAAELTPDEARLIGVRLIDAAVLADGARAIRQPPQ